MNELRCPECGKVFCVEQSDYDSILAQVRTDEFQRQVTSQVEAQKSVFEEKIENYKQGFAVEKKDIESKLTTKIKELENKLASLDEVNRSNLKVSLSEKENTISSLMQKISYIESQKENDIKLALSEKNEEIVKKDIELIQLKEKIETVSKDKLLALSEQKHLHDKEISILNDQIEYLKDFKAKQSTKALGESLELYCKNQFDIARQTGYRNAYFEKDNSVKENSKGDFIFRDYTDDGVEFISIMFEMKNEMDTTATKHKNEDFFKELDKDRNLKGCEYAVLVSTLEADSDYYNTGIVDVSYKYPKMYVVRPQFFLSLISLLKNAAMATIEYRRKAIEAEKHNIDVSKFETKLHGYKKSFEKHCQANRKKYEDAIKHIDETIKKLESVKRDLEGADNNLRLANNDIQDITIRKLTWDNPTLKAAFEEARALNSNQVALPVLDNDEQDE